MHTSKLPVRAGAGQRVLPKAYVISRDQHDPLTALKLVDLLLAQGIEVKRAAKGFVADGKVYPEGSFVVSLAQPKMGVIRNLLGRTFSRTITGPEIPTAHP